MPVVNGLPFDLNDLTHPEQDWADLITIDTPFEADCYPAALVDYINSILNEKELTAEEMWRLICLEVYNQYDYPDGNNGEPVDYNLDTAPRELLLVIIMRRKIFGYRKLAEIFGMLPLNPCK